MYKISMNLVMFAIFIDIDAAFDDNCLSPTHPQRTSKLDVRTETAHEHTVILA